VHFCNCYYIILILDTIKYVTLVIFIDCLPYIWHALQFCMFFLVGCYSCYSVLLSLAVRAKERVEYKLLSRTYKVLTTSQPKYLSKLSLFSLLAVLDPRLLSPYPDHLLPYLSKLQTVLFNMQHPAFGINSLTLSVCLIHFLVFHLLTTLHKSDPHCHHHLCHHQSILL